MLPGSLASLGRMPLDPMTSLACSPAGAQFS